MSLPIDDLKNRLKQALSIRNTKPIELSEKTGIPKSAISQYTSGYAKPKQDRIYLICRALNIDEAWLMGYDVPMERTPTNLTTKDKKDISSILASTEELLKQDGLMFDGEPASPESIDSILSALKIGMEMAKQKNKEKYTPKKYKKE